MKDRIDTYWSNAKSIGPYMGIQEELRWTHTFQGIGEIVCSDIVNLDRLELGVGLPEVAQEVDLPATSSAGECVRSVNGG